MTWTTARRVSLLMFLLATLASVTLFLIPGKRSFDEEYATLETQDAGDDPRMGTNPVTLYPVVPLSKIAGGKYSGPRATVSGTVGKVSKQTDGDYHFILIDGSDKIVCEIVPDMVPVLKGAFDRLMPQGVPLDPNAIRIPKQGQRVRVRGIVREDKKHGWWELHPVLEWEPL